MPLDVMSNYFHDSTDHIFESVKYFLSRTIAHDHTYCLPYDIETTTSTLTTRTPIMSRLAPPTLAIRTLVRHTRFKKFFGRKVNSQSSVKQMFLFV